MTHHPLTVALAEDRRARLLADAADHRAARLALGHPARRRAPQPRRWLLRLGFLDSRVTRPPIGDLEVPGTPG